MLSFARLREVNVRRCVQGFKHALSDWSSAEWGCATAGECGEACNIAKKIIRVRDGLEVHNKGITLNQLKAKLADEIADLVIYADLWAASEGIDLGESVRKKFNEKSRELGCEEL